MTGPEPRQRPPRPKRPHELWRIAIEAAAFAVLLIVVLTFFAVVLAERHGKTAPPADALLVSQTEDFASLDPALAQTQQAWELEYATCAKLVNYPPLAGYRGTRLVPEVAESMPRLSKDRVTYTFTIRRGWRFSDGTPVTARSFTRAARCAGGAYTGTS